MNDITKRSIGIFISICVIFGLSIAYYNQYQNVDIFLFTSYIALHTLIISVHSYKIEKQKNKESEYKRLYNELDLKDYKRLMDNEFVEDIEASSVVRRSKGKK